MRSAQILREIAARLRTTLAVLADREDETRIAAAFPEVDRIIAVPHSRRLVVQLLQLACSSVPFIIRNRTSRPLREQLDRLFRTEKFDLIWVDNCLSMGNLPESARAQAHVDLHNNDIALFRQLIEAESSWHWRLLAWIQWRRMCRFIRTELPQYRSFSYVGVDDSAELLNLNPNGVYLPNGVTGSNPAARQEGESTSIHLVFIGTLAYRPNYWAAWVLVNEVVPLLESRGVSFRCDVVGAHGGQFERRCRPSPRVRFLGRLPTLDSLWEARSVLVVPLKHGSGSRLKILTAAERHIPVISTRIGAAGLPFQDGAEIVLRDTPEGIADAICEAAADFRPMMERARRAAAMAAHELEWGCVINRALDQLVGDGRTCVVSA